MKNNIKKLIENKKVLILGFGKEGKSTFDFLNNIGGYASLDIADSKEESPNLSNVYHGGVDYQKVINSYDIVFKSPGVELEEKTHEALITSQMTLFLENYHNQIIGVTGTKGKSTTVSIINHVLSYFGKDVILCGNIGFPAFDIIDKITSESIIVTELSSYQLEEIKYSPKTALFLNIYEDHLQRYKVIDKYFDAKANIYKFQESSDTLLVGENVYDLINKENKKLITEKDVPGFLKDNYSKLKLKGEKNLLNITFAYTVLKEYGITEEMMQEAMECFEPLAHRLEFVATVNKVDYYDDSISTTVESAINAVTSIKNTKTLLLGGVDRGINYNLIVDFIKNSSLDNILLMYASGEKIYNLLKEANIDKNYILFNNLDECVSWSLENCKENTACILSPASASHGYFKNFEDRGDYFQMLVKKGN